MNSALRKLIYGDANIKEYATVTLDDKPRESVQLEIGETVIDVSQNHWLLCLAPVMFGIWLEKGNDTIVAGNSAACKMYFKDIASSKTLASLALEYSDRIDDAEGSLILLKLNSSRIYHINFFKAHLLFQQFYKKPKLSFEQLKGFASAYSYPRKVRVISFKDGDYYNIFPMDLLGNIPQTNKYVFGLRHTNTTLAKIIATKRIVVSEFSFQHKETIYQLGSHHGSAPPAVDKLPFKVISSKNFGFYIPDWVDSYREISIKKTINLGSHMLMWGEVEDEVILKSSAGHLFHIHYLLYLYHKCKGFVYPLA